jgi:hypothetical protein
MFLYLYMHLFESNMNSIKTTIVPIINCVCLNKHSSKEKLVNCSFYKGFLNRHNSKLWTLIYFLLPSKMVGCEICFMRNGTNVDNIITNSLFIPLGMLNVISLKHAFSPLASLSMRSILGIFE